jgi:hypothetical protein
MNRRSKLLRASALVSSAGLMGTYVACQQNGGRLSAAGDLPQPVPAGYAGSRPATAAAPNLATATYTLGGAEPLDSPRMMAGSKSAIVFDPKLGTPPAPALFAGSKSARVVSPEQVAWVTTEGPVFPPPGPKLSGGASAATAPAAVPQTQPQQPPATRPAGR